MYFFSFAMMNSFLICIYHLLNCVCPASLSRIDILLGPVSTLGEISSNLFRCFILVPVVSSYTSIIQCLAKYSRGLCRPAGSSFSMMLSPLWSVVISSCLGLSDSELNHLNSASLGSSTWVPFPVRETWDICGVHLLHLLGSLSWELFERF